MAMLGVNSTSAMPGYTNASVNHSSNATGKTRRPSSTSLATSQSEIVQIPISSSYPNRRVLASQVDGHGRLNHNQRPRASKLV
jgi:hypothetical protein